MAMQLPTFFKKFYINLHTIQTKYGLIKASIVRKKWEIEMYLTHSEEKVVVAERFIKTLKN